MARTVRTIRSFDPTFLFIAIPPFVGPVLGGESGQSKWQRGRRLAVTGISSAGVLNGAMMTATVLLLTALAASAAAQGQGPAQGGATKQNWPPPIVSVPSYPSPPFRAVPAPPPGPPPQLPIIVDPPRARAPLQALISELDYPASALANREQGRVEFRLDVGANGRVLRCTITRSSGSSALDATTCRILRSRARYTPARNSNGMPVGYPVEDAVEWRLPEKGGERG